MSFDATGLTVFTAPLRYDGDDRLDVTRLGNDPFGVAFAPSLALLRPYKALQRAGRAGPDAWTRYARAYGAEMATALLADPAPWRALVARQRVTLCCYCAAGGPCHRVVLARILAACGAAYEGERAVGGGDA